MIKIDDLKAPHVTRFPKMKKKKLWAASDNCDSLGLWKPVYKINCNLSSSIANWIYKQKLICQLYPWSLITQSRCTLIGSITVNTSNRLQYKSWKIANICQLSYFICECSFVTIILRNFSVMSNDYLLTEYRLHIKLKNNFDQTLFFFSSHS